MPIQTIRALLIEYDARRIVDIHRTLVDLLQIWQSSLTE